MTFVPSPYQQAVFDQVIQGRGSLLINAVAGSGKSSTLLQLLARLPQRATVTFLAFNKSIATELNGKAAQMRSEGTALPERLRISTFHSAGYGALSRGAKVKIGAPDDKKLYTLLDDRARFTQEDADTYGSVAPKLVSLARNAGIGFLQPDEPASWMAIVDHFGLDMEFENGTLDRAIRVAQKLLQASTQTAAAIGTIDFDDMLYLPMLWRLPFFQVDWLLVDESQDTNALQLAMLRRMLKPGGRLIAVGDRNQAIYGFRGADASAMDNIKAAFNCTELPLSISYRCAQSVVRLAQTIVPQIEAHPDAPEGQVVSCATWPEWQADPSFFATDAIICRNTAPLVSKAYALIAEGVGCRVLGRDIGRGLVSLINRMKAKDTETLRFKLDAHLAKMAAKFMAKGQETKAQALQDQIESIYSIIDHVTVVDQAGTPEPQPTKVVLDAIALMFTDDDSRPLLTLCTAHKSKGREWERVFILAPELMPSKWARQGWQQQQELNLQYVAWTRAKHTLATL